MMMIIIPTLYSQPPPQEQGMRNTGGTSKGAMFIWAYKFCRGKFLHGLHTNQCTIAIGLMVLKRPFLPMLSSEGTRRSSTRVDWRLSWDKWYVCKYPLGYPTLPTLVILVSEIIGVFTPSNPATYVQLPLGGVQRSSCDLAEEKAMPSGNFVWLFIVYTTYDHELP